LGTPQYLGKKMYKVNITKTQWFLNFPSLIENSRIIDLLSCFRGTQHWFGEKINVEGYKVEPYSQKQSYKSATTV
jgi:hypothetical protein